MRLYHYCCLVLVLSFYACKKETIIPAEPHVGAAVFGLPGTGIICSNNQVGGVYTVGSELDNSNFVNLQVNVVSPGAYVVSTDRINGITFYDSGSFVSKGVQQITLKGTGMPLAAGLYAYLFTAGTASCRFTVPTVNPIPQFTDNDHLLFGNPSKAATLEDSGNNFLMRKSWYALSYSKDRGTPNWVSWHLNSADIGTVSRADDFRPDASLPGGWYQVSQNSYSGSGFDRGHNIPSGDRTNTNEANSATFLMTNMIPQAPQHNQVTWANMEDSLRRLVSMGNELYVVMGSYGSGGTGSNGFATTINSGKVTVPASIWKIALVIPNGDNDSSRVNSSTRLIAVNIPNNNSVSSSWKSYRVSVDAIEAATGYDLLSRLPVALQASLEGKIDKY